MCQEVCAVKYVPKSTNTELLQNQSDLNPDIITQLIKFALFVTQLINVQYCFKISNRL